MCIYIYKCVWHILIATINSQCRILKYFSNGDGVVVTCQDIRNKYENTNISQYFKASPNPSNPAFPCFVTRSLLHSFIISHAFNLISFYCALQKVCWPFA